MNAKVQAVEAVQSALDVLRGALETRNAMFDRVREIAAKAERLAPIQNTVEEAQAALDAILQEDAMRLQEWADAGASGEPPAVDTKRREAASRALADAKQRLAASGDVKASLDRAILAANERLRDHGKVLAAALTDVLGEEAMRAVEGMRKTSLALLRSEAHFLTIREQMQGLADQAHTNGDDRTSRAFGSWLAQIDHANQITVEERAKAATDGRLKATTRLDKLKAGEFPND